MSAGFDHRRAKDAQDQIRDKSFTELVQDEPFRIVSGRFDSFGIVSSR